MIYPIFVFSVFLIILTIMMTYVIPQLSSVLEASNSELPAITKTVIGISDFLKNNILTLTIVTIFIVLAVIVLAKSKEGKKFFGDLFLKIPIMGSFFKKLYLARLALNLSTLISGGIPIAQALEMTADVIGNNEYKQIVSKTEEGVKRGKTMSSVLSGYPSLIPPLFQQMVSVGEKTGSLDSSLKNVVVFYQREVDRSLDSFISLLEPIFIVLLGGVVGGLMAAVLLPIYSGSMF